MGGKGGDFNFAKARAIHEAAHTFGVGHAIRIPQSQRETCRGDATVERLHRGADGLVPNGVGAAVVAKDVVPAVSSPELPSGVHAETGRSGARDDDNTRTGFGGAGPRTDHVVLHDCDAVVIEELHGTLGNGEVEIGIESGETHTDGADLAQRDIGGTQSRDDSIGDVGAGCLHADRAIVGRPSGGAPGATKVFANDGSCGFGAATVNTDHVFHQEPPGVLVLGRTSVVSGCEDTPKASFTTASIAASPGGTSGDAAPPLSPVLVSHSRYSWLPSRPVMGEATSPLAVSHGPAGRTGVLSHARRSRRTRRWTAGSLMTPAPRATSARPASNCGLTRATIQPPARSSLAAPGRTSRSEMKETSMTAQSALSGSAVRWRMLVRSIITTRGSVRSAHASCPCPTSMA